MMMIDNGRSVPANQEGRTRTSPPPPPLVQIDPAPTVAKKKTGAKSKSKSNSAEKNSIETDSDRRKRIEIDRKEEAGCATTSISTSEILAPSLVSVVERKESSGSSSSPPQDTSAGVKKFEQENSGGDDPTKLPIVEVTELLCGCLRKIWTNKTEVEFLKWNRPPIILTVLQPFLWIISLMTAMVYTDRIMALAEESEEYRRSSIRWFKIVALWSVAFLEIMAAVIVVSCFLRHHCIKNWTELELGYWLKIFANSRAVVLAFWDAISLRTICECVATLYPEDDPARATPEAFRSCLWQPRALFMSAALVLGADMKFATIGFVINVIGCLYLDSTCPGGSWSPQGINPSLTLYIFFATLPLFVILYAKRQLDRRAFKQKLELERKQEYVENHVKNTERLLFMIGRDDKMLAQALDTGVCSDLSSESTLCLVRISDYHTWSQQRTPSSSARILDKFITRLQSYREELQLDALPSPLITGGSFLVGSGLKDGSKSHNPCTIAAFAFFAAKFADSLNFQLDIGIVTGRVGFAAIGKSSRIQYSIFGPAVDTVVQKVTEGVEDERNAVQLSKASMRRCRKLSKKALVTIPILPEVGGSSRPATGIGHRLRPARILGASSPAAESSEYTDLVVDINVQAVRQTLLSLSARTRNTAATTSQQCLQRNTSSEKAQLLVAGRSLAARHHRQQQHTHEGEKPLSSSQKAHEGQPHPKLPFCILEKEFQAVKTPQLEHRKLGPRGKNWREHSDDDAAAILVDDEDDYKGDFDSINPPADRNPLKGEFSDHLGSKEEGEQSLVDSIGEQQQKESIFSGDESHQVQQVYVVSEELVGKPDMFNYILARSENHNNIQARVWSGSSPSEKDELTTPVRFYGTWNVGYRLGFIPFLQEGHGTERAFFVILDICFCAIVVTLLMFYAGQDISHISKVLAGLRVALGLAFLVFNSFEKSIFGRGGKDGRGRRRDLSKTLCLPIRVNCGGVLMSFYASLDYLYAVLSAGLLFAVLDQATIILPNGEGEGEGEAKLSPSKGLFSANLLLLMYPYAHLFTRLLGSCPWQQIVFTQIILLSATLARTLQNLSQFSEYFCANLKVAGEVDCPQTYMDQYGQVIVYVLVSVAANALLAFSIESIRRNKYIYTSLGTILLEQKERDLKLYRGLVNFFVPQYLTRNLSEKTQLLEERGGLGCGRAVERLRDCSVLVLRFSPPSGRGVGSPSPFLPGANVSHQITSSRTPPPQAPLINANNRTTSNLITSPADGHPLRGGETTPTSPTAGALPFSASSSSNQLLLEGSKSSQITPSLPVEQQLSGGGGLSSSSSANRVAGGAGAVMSSSSSKDPQHQQPHQQHSFLNHSHSSSNAWSDYGGGGGGSIAAAADQQMILGDFGKELDLDLLEQQAVIVSRLDLIESLIQPINASLKKRAATLGRGKGGGGAATSSRHNNINRTNDFVDPEIFIIETAGDTIVIGGPPIEEALPELEEEDAALTTTARHLKVPSRMKHMQRQLRREEEEGGGGQRTPQQMAVTDEGERVLERSSPIDRKQKTSAGTMDLVSLGLVQFLSAFVKMEYLNAASSLSVLKGGSTLTSTSCVLHRNDGLAVILGTQPPQFSLQGAVMTQCYQLVDAATQGFKGATAAFYDQLSSEGRSIFSPDSLAAAAERRPTFAEPAATKGPISVCPSPSPPSSTWAVKNVGLVKMLTFKGAVVAAASSSTEHDDRDQEGKNKNVLPNPLGGFYYEI